MASADDLQHAKAYPFDAPDRSYVFKSGGWRTLSKDDPRPGLDDRHAVLACGSNRSPEQLARKFGQSTSDGIVVLRVRVHGFEVVYSPHFSSYGSIPATLHPAKGVVTDMFATWLTDDQLAHMHTTEAVGTNYDFGRLDGIRVVIDGGGTLNTIYAYIGRYGALSHGGKPLSIISTDQITAQTIARDRLSPETPLDEFIAVNIDDGETRQARTETLAADAIAFDYPGFCRLAV